MASITRVDTSARYSEAVVHAGTVYLAGQVPSDDAAAGDAKAQTADVLAQIDALLARCGSDKTRVLSATIYLTDLDADYALMNAAWEAWMPAGCAPARATVGVSRLAHARWRVEISVVAAAAAVAAVAAESS